MTATKWCTRCQDHLPITEFGFRRSGNPARRSWCNACIAEDWRARRAGHSGLSPTFRDLAPRVLLCTCTVAEVARGQAGACVCGLPIVALMSPRNQAAMDERWPQWREQVVLGVAEAEWVNA